jgi:hypothetical protein
MRTSEAGDSDDALTDNWPKGQAARAVDLDCDWPVTVGKVGGYTPVAADLAALADYFLNVFSLAYGDKAQHKPYEAVTGNKLRRFLRIMEGVEVYNDFVGVAKAQAAHVLHCRIRLAINRKWAKGLKRVIGSTQGRTLKFDVREGNAFPAQGAALLSRTAGVDAVIRVIPVYTKGGDKFAHFPFYREVNRAAQDVTFPDGTPYAIWDDNAKADNTAIAKYDLRIGEQHLHRLLEPTYPTRDFRENLDAGGSDFTDEVTPFYVADPFEDLKKLPTGVPNVQLVAQDVAMVMGRCLYQPPIGDEASSIVAEAAAARKEVVTGRTVNAPTDPEDNGSAATADIEFIGAADGRAATVSGLRADRDGNVAVFVPEAIQSLGRAAPSMAASVEKVAALSTPGTHGTNGRSLGNVARSRIRGVFAAFRR